MIDDVKGRTELPSLQKVLTRGGALVGTEDPL